MGKYKVPPIVESQSSILYSTFGQVNFQLRMDVIYMFQNALRFFEKKKTIENPDARISKFLDMLQRSSIGEFLAKQLD